MAEKIKRAFEAETSAKQAKKCGSDPLGDRA
jgi:hypothetical protein